MLKEQTPGKIDALNVSIEHLSELVQLLHAADEIPEARSLLASILYEAAGALRSIPEESSQPTSRETQPISSWSLAALIETITSVAENSNFHQAATTRLINIIAYNAGGILIGSSKYPRVHHLIRRDFLEAVSAIETYKEFDRWLWENDLSCSGLGVRTYQLLRLAVQEHSKDTPF